MTKHWDNIVLTLIAAALLLGSVAAFRHAAAINERGLAIVTEIDQVEHAVGQLTTDIATVSERLGSIEHLLTAETLTPTDEAAQDLPAIVYRVRPGDTLWQIAESLLGSPWLYREIAEINQIQSPGLIRPGERLIIPVNHLK